MSCTPNIAFTQLLASIENLTPSNKYLPYPEHINPHKEPKTAQYTNARAKAETIHKNLGFLHSHGDAT